MSENLFNYNPIQEWTGDVADVGMSTHGGNLRVTTIITSSENATEATLKCNQLAVAEPFFKDAGSSNVLEVVRSFFTSDGLASVSQLTISTNLIEQEVAHCSDPTYLEELVCLAIGQCSDPTYNDNQTDCLTEENIWIGTNAWLQPTGWSVPKATVSIPVTTNRKTLDSYPQTYDIDNNSIPCNAGYELIDGVCYDWATSNNVSIEKCEVSWFRFYEEPLTLTLFDTEFRVNVQSYPVDAPTSLNATDGDNQMPGFVQVTWVAVAGSVSYNIYRSIDKDAFNFFDQDNLTSNQELLGNTADIWFSDVTLSNIGTHYYWVGALSVTGSGAIRVGDLSPGFVRCSEEYTCEPYSEDTDQASCEAPHHSICVNTDTGLELMVRRKNDPNTWHSVFETEINCSGNGMSGPACYYERTTNLTSPRSWYNLTAGNAGWTESACTKGYNWYPQWYFFWHDPSINTWQVGGTGDWIENYAPEICVNHGATWEVELPGEEGSMSGDEYMELVEDMVVSSGQYKQITVSWTSNPTVNPLIGDCYKCEDIGGSLISIYVGEDCVDSGDCSNPSYNNNPTLCVDPVSGYCSDTTFTFELACESIMCSDQTWGTQALCGAAGTCNNLGTTYDNNQFACESDGTCSFSTYTTESTCEIARCSDTAYADQATCEGAGSCWDKNVLPEISIPAYDNNQNQCEADINGYCLDTTHNSSKAFCETAICSDPTYPSSLQCITSGTCSNPTYTDQFNNCLDLVNGYCELTTGLGLHTTQYSGYSGNAGQDFDGNFNWFDTATLTSSWIDTQVYSNGNNSQQYFARKRQGYFKTTHAGVYTFRINSDDSTWLWVGNKDEDIDDLITRRNNTNELIDNSGPHGARSISNTITLDAHSYYPILMYFGQGWGNWREELYFTPPGDVETYVGGNFYRQDNLSDGPATYPNTEALCEDNVCSNYNLTTQQTCEDEGICSNTSYNNQPIVCVSDANGYCSDLSGQSKQLCIDEGTCSEVIYNNDPAGCVNIANGICSDFPLINNTQASCENAYSCSDITWTDEVSCVDLAGLCFNVDGVNTPAYDNLQTVCTGTGHCWDGVIGSGTIVTTHTTASACTLSGFCSDPTFGNESACILFNADNGWCDDVAETSNPNYTTLNACQLDRCSDPQYNNSADCLGMSGACTNTQETNQTDCEATAYCSDFTSQNQLACEVDGTCVGDATYNNNKLVCIDPIDGGTCTDTTKNHDYSACTSGISNGLCQDSSWTTDPSCTSAGSCVNSQDMTTENGLTCGFPTTDESAWDNSSATCLSKGNCYVRVDYLEPPGWIPSCQYGHVDHESSSDWKYTAWYVTDIAQTSCNPTSAETWFANNNINHPEIYPGWYNPYPAYRAGWESNEYIYPQNSTVDNGNRTWGTANTWTPNTWTPNTWTADNTWYPNGASWTPTNNWGQQHTWLAHTWTDNGYNWSGNQWTNDGNTWARTYTWDNPNTFTYANSWNLNTFLSAGNTWAPNYSWWNNSYLTDNNTWYAGSTWNTYTFDNEGNSWAQQHTWTPYQFTNDNNTWQQQHTWNLNTFTSDGYSWNVYPTLGDQTICPAQNGTWVPDPAFQNPAEEYNIYRTDTAGHTANPPEYHYVDTIPHYGVDVSTQTFVDDTQKETIDYYYKVTQKSNGIESEFGPVGSGYETQ